MANGDSLFKYQHVEKVVNNGGSGAIYGLGIIGALVYFLQRADSFWAVILGIVKAIFWPAVLVYEVLKLLQL
ncbi:MAG: hypothetical protein WD231_00470 [Candidatus Woykebacteria bacterium]